MWDPLGEGSKPKLPRQRERWEIETRKQIPRVLETRGVGYPCAEKILLEVGLESMGVARCNKHPICSCEPLTARESRKRKGLHLLVRSINPYRASLSRCMISYINSLGYRYCCKYTVK